MSDEAARGIDPRFDPRFQRGYVSDAAANARKPARREPTAPPSPIETELYGPGSVGTAAERSAPLREEARVLEADRTPEPDHAAALLAYFAPEQGETGSRARPVPDDEAMFAPRSDAPSTPGPSRIGPPPSTSAVHSDLGMRAGEGAGDDDFVVEPELESESPFVRHPALRYWTALAISVVFVVVGAWLSWNMTRERMSPSGTMADQAEAQAFLSAVAALSAGLVQAGALGTVVVLAVWALQSARGRRS
ncbi:hypothetical protein [Agromyces sp. NPDC058110]|uniref:hypothetical protein n=1 Tax=Agromyces sp. NPDC058110 TaxID=3346345 RepID=UPI0036D928D9